MSSDPRAKIFASLQAEDKPDLKYPQPRRFRPSDYDISEHEMRTGLYERVPPDPERVQQLLERLQARYGTANRTSAEFQESLKGKFGPNIIDDVPAWRAQRAAEKAAKALKQEQKASETRVEQTIDAAMGLKDEALFGTNALNDLASVLEEENQFVQDIQTQTETLKIAVQNITATAKTLEPETKPEISSAVQPAHHDDLHTQLEQAIGETLPLFNIQTDAEADLKAKAIGAIAFTQGDTIYFQSGKFDPNSVEGFKLLVHEATHISQQAKGQAPDGVDSSPELEQAAQQKASQVLSPAKAFSKDELGAFTGQLQAAYKTFGSQPERFSSIAETWHDLPEAARKGVRSRFFLGRNERSLETQKLNEAFDSRINAAIETKVIPQQLENPFLKPSGINVQFDTPRTTLEPVQQESSKLPVPQSRVSSPTRSLGRTGMTRSSHATSRALQRDQAPGAETPVNKFAFVREEGLNLRQQPNQQSTSQGTFPIGTKVFVVSKTGEWLKVLVDGSKTGYMLASKIHGLTPQHQALLQKDPGLRLTRVKNNESGWALVKRMYGIQGNESTKDQGIYHFLNAIRSINNPSMFKIVMQGNAAQRTAGELKNWAGDLFGSGLDANDVQLQQGDLWIPSFNVAAKMDVGSGTMGGEVARVEKKVKQKIADFKTACSLSQKYIGTAVTAQVGKSAEGLVTGLIDFALKAAGIIAVSTAVGAIIGAFAGGVGAAPGAALGFEIGLQIIEIYGLAMLIQWLAQSLKGIGGAFGSFIGQVWSANGDQKALEQAAKTLADAIAKLVGFLLEALAAFVIAKGSQAVMKTKFADTVGKTELGKWVGTRVQNQQARRNNAINTATNTARDWVDTRRGERQMRGRPVKPTERTMEFALDKTAYANAIAKKYGMNLRGVSGKVEIVIDAAIRSEGVTRYAEKGRVIRIQEEIIRSGNEGLIVNTIAHELSHAREFQQAWKAGYKTLLEAERAGVIKPHGTSSSVGDRTPYGSGNALEDYINGGR
jgi:Domain of unknown function (DUF4157)/Bacterial SH3 domain